MNLWEKIAEQFGKPSGLVGRIAGLIMATRASNVERNEWGISLLNIQPSDHVGNRVRTWCSNPKNVRFSNR